VKPMQRLVPPKSLVMVVDVQERLATAMPQERLQHAIRKILILLGAAEVLKVPVVGTEQYPRGLGKTVPEIDQKLVEVGARRMEKLTFSAASVPEVSGVLTETRPAAVIVTGMEAHVCVYQTVRDLVGEGIEVYLPVDAVVSRKEEDRAAGIALCERAGAIPTTVEAVVFDWLERAGTDAFRAVSKLVR